MKGRGLLSLPMFRRIENDRPVEFIVVIGILRQVLFRFLDHFSSPRQPFRVLYDDYSMAFPLALFKIFLYDPPRKCCKK